MTSLSLVRPWPLCPFSRISLSGSMIFRGDHDEAAKIRKEENALSRSTTGSFRPEPQSEE